VKSAKKVSEAVSPMAASQKAASSIAEYLEADSENRVKGVDLLKAIEQSGVRLDDPRVVKFTSAIHDALEKANDRSSVTFNIDSFRELGGENLLLVERILAGDLVIPEFHSFKKEVQKIFESVRDEVIGGKNADYIPQLAKVNPNQFGVSFCSIDGQVMSFGDSKVPFCVQSCSKAINYLLALEENGTDKVFQHIGTEPSGDKFNALTLNDKGLPHNPMLNAGGIMSSSLIRPYLSEGERFDYLMGIWSRLCGGSKIGFSNPVYLSERATADKNFCLGYMMRGANAFPENVDLVKTLELYFQCCSIEVNSEESAVLTATLANSGVCPLTGDMVFKAENVKHCLSLMYTCGMYDFSGEWAFHIGLPAKSGVGGSVYGIIPGFGGFCAWSPPLDKIGNSVKGVEFFKRLVQKFNFHHFDGEGIPIGSALVAGKKWDVAKRHSTSHFQELIALLYAATEGNLAEVRRHIAKGIPINTGDYDKRTALHLAASEGRLSVVEYLLRKGANHSALDRWGGSPLDDAIRSKHKEVAKVLVKSGAKTALFTEKDLKDLISV
jgi:glutaminase